MATFSKAQSNTWYSAAKAEPDARARFIRNTYMHLAGAVGAFVGVEFILLQTGLGESMLRFIAKNQYGWIMLLGAFILAGWMARSLAASGKSVGLQYLGLGVYVVAEALIFLPLLYLAANFYAPDVIPIAGLLTAALFGGLTMVVFTTRKDFSFLGGILAIAGPILLGVIICSAIFGFTLGLIFSGIMVLVASIAILYDTSKILHHYPPDRHVAASLELFASVALLFFYILRIVMMFSRD